MNRLILAMVKFQYSMNLYKQSVNFPKPSPMKALTAGFDAISRHLFLIIFSIILDLLFWLGPRLRMAHLFNTTFAGVIANQSPETTRVFSILASAIQDLNFLSILRTYPVGVPSLIASRLSSETPLGRASGWEIPSSPMAFGLWLILILVGIAAGTILFTLVAQSALTGRVVIRDALTQWPRASIQMGVLTIICFGMLMAAFVPFSCLAAFMLGGSTSGQAGNWILLIFLGFILWLFAPLLFSPHGIIVHQSNAIASIMKGFYLTRLTLPSTSVLLLVMILISEGLDVLWRIPDNSSWLLMLGIAGHAFVTTSLLASSFVYYRDAENWINEIVKEMKLSSA